MCAADLGKRITGLIVLGRDALQWKKNDELQQRRNEMQFGHRRQSDGVLSIDAGLNGTNQ